MICVRAMRSRVFVTTTFLAGICPFRPAAFAYSPMPDAGHKVLSNFPIDLFNRCVERGYGDPEQALKKSERERIVKANRREDSTRSFTLARLDDDICDEPGSLRVSWHHFWLPPEAGRYFGAYRPGAQFGELKEINDGGLKCESTTETYRIFATDLHLEAVFACVRAHYWFSAPHSRKVGE